MTRKGTLEPPILTFETYGTMVLVRTGARSKAAMHSN